MDYKLKSLIALTYIIDLKTISASHVWIHSQHFNIEGISLGGIQATRLEQIRMLRALIVEKFGLKFHRIV